MKYNSHSRNLSLNFKDFSGSGIRFSDKTYSKSIFNVDMDEIHDILKKNIEKKKETHSCNYRISLKVEKYIKKSEKLSQLKRDINPSSFKNYYKWSQVHSYYNPIPCIFMPLQIRCVSPTLKLKHSKPKISSTQNNFIVKKIPSIKP
jgi:hypothetical protein